MLVKAYSGLHFEVSVRGKEEFGERCDEIHGKGWILADSDKDIILDINCFKPEDFVEKVPAILIELYVDGILRNVVRPRTGRGMAENQFAESTVEQGVVLTESGGPQLKKFRFTDLDLDDAVLKCRLVEEAGKIEVRIIQAGPKFNEVDDIPFELPVVVNDRCAVSMFCGDLNNTIGVRFDEGAESFKDLKAEKRLQSSVELMIARQNEMLGETVAIFSFQYGSNAILHHLGYIPDTHKGYDEALATDRLEVRTRLDEGLSPILKRKAVSDSDYTLYAAIGELDKEPDFSIPAASTCVVRPLKRRLAVASGCSSKNRMKAIRVTPEKKLYDLALPISPPLTPEEEVMIKCDPKHSGDE